MSHHSKVMSSTTSCLDALPEDVLTDVLSRLHDVDPQTAAAARVALGKHPAVLNARLHKVKICANTAAQLRSFFRFQQRHRVIDSISICCSSANVTTSCPQTLRDMHPEEYWKSDSVNLWLLFTGIANSTCQHLSLDKCRYLHTPQRQVVVFCIRHHPVQQ